MVPPCFPDKIGALIQALPCLNPFNGGWSRLNLLMVPHGSVSSSGGIFREGVRLLAPDQARLSTLVSPTLLRLRFYLPYFTRFSAWLHKSIYLVVYHFELIIFETKYSPYQQAPIEPFLFSPTFSKLEVF